MLSLIKLIHSRKHEARWNFLGSLANKLSRIAPCVYNRVYTYIMHRGDWSFLLKDHHTSNIK